MSTDNVTTWRELANQLTPEQVAEIEYCEREEIPPGIASEQSRINHARAFVRLNLAQAICADVPVPADAIDTPSAWDEWADQGAQFQRVYAVSDTTTGGTRVQILGYQNEHNEIYRRIYVDGTLEDLDAANARAIAAALTAAADRLDQLDQLDR